MSLARNGTILFAATMAGNVSNYLFQFFMGKYLPIEDYGALNAVFSLLVIVAIPATTIMLVVARYSAMFRALGERGKISSLYRNSLFKMTLLGLIFFLPFLFLREPIADYLKINTAMPVAIIGAAVFLSFIVTVNLGALQGLQKFYAFGIGMGLTGVLKLAFGVAFVYLGLGLNGAVASMVFAGALVFALTSWPLLRYFGTVDRAAPVEKHTREIASYAIPVLASTLAVTLLTNVDIIIVKHFFPARDAGLYAAVAILGRTVLYLPAAFVLAIFPMVSGEKNLDEKTFGILDRALVYTVAISLAGVILFSLFPELIIKVCFGERFLSAAPLLKYYALAMMFMAVMNILISFNLARNRTSFIYTLAAGPVALLVLFNFFHATLFTIVLCMLTINILISMTHLWMTHRERKGLFSKKNVRRSDGDKVGIYNYPG